MCFLKYLFVMITVASAKIALSSTSTQSLVKYLTKEQRPAPSPALSLQEDANHGLTQAFKTKKVLFGKPCDTEYCTRHLNGEFCEATEYYSETTAHKKGTREIKVKKSEQDKK